MGCALEKLLLKSWYKVNNIYNYKINKIDIRAGNPNIYEKW